MYLLETTTEKKLSFSTGYFVSPWQLYFKIVMSWPFKINISGKLRCKLTLERLGSSVL